MGFDNAATDSSGNYLSNIVTFTASQEGPVTVNPNIQNVTRSTMIVSFWKLNARHVGTLSYKVTLNPFYACSVTATPAESETAVAARVVAVAPTITREATNREEIDSESQHWRRQLQERDLIRLLLTMHFTALHTKETVVVQRGQQVSVEWQTASRTQLTLTLGPTVDINNAGDMYGSVTDDGEI